MHYKYLLLRNLLYAGLLLFSATCTHQPSPAEKPANEFSFVFMTDIHVQREKNAISGFRKAIVKVNELKPDFVITGGDLVMDAFNQPYERADSLFRIYSPMLTEFRMPVFNTPGNHDIYGWDADSGAGMDHPEYGKKMFEKRIGPRYQRIDRFGWVFFILDSVEKDEEYRYKGEIDEEQVIWLKDQLEHIDPATPIAISVHIPLMTSAGQVYDGSTAGNAPTLVIVNAKEVLGLFKEHNLKLVLQGHLHFYEEIFVQDVRYITGGAVCGAWWEGSYFGTEEGFLLFKVTGDSFTWKYVDYGWKADLQLR